MKYAHLADLHLGSWREQKMRDLSTQTFLTAMDICLKENVDFILFAGDLFNTSLPSLDTLKIVTRQLKALQEKNIPVYVIAGSHDFSPSGKTMIDVLEQAGLLVNVCKGSILPETKQLQLRFTIDPKTGAKITGILGRKGMLDRSYYENLHLQNLEQEPGYKIFMFHTLLSEMKPSHLEQMESQPASFLPKGFSYYAGGHIHHPTQIELPDYGTLTYPGALFPNNFAEVEKYGHGGFYLISVNSSRQPTGEDSSQEKGQQRISWVPVEIKPHLKLDLNCSGKTPDIIAFEISELVGQKQLQDALITLRLQGSFSQGHPSEIPYAAIEQRLQEKGAFLMLRNTSNLGTREMEEVQLGQLAPEVLEERLIEEHLQQLKIFSKEVELHLTRSLLAGFNTTKKEGETVTDFQRRVEEEANHIFQLPKEL